MDIIQSELMDLQWEDGFVYHIFDGQWFNTKYNIEYTWKENKVVLLFPNNTFPHTEELQLQFPLLDMLKANMEYKEDDFASFMQQHNIPERFQPFIQRNIGEIQSAKVTKLLESYYNHDAFSEDVAIRGLISSYLSEKKILDWDTIYIKMMILELDEEGKKRGEFYARIEKNPDVRNKIHQNLNHIFGVSYNQMATVRMKGVIESLKYNGITQLLAISPNDPYKNYHIVNSIAISNANKILETGLNTPALSESFSRVMSELGSTIRESEILKIYGLDAQYYRLFEELAIQIIEQVLTTNLVADPTATNEKMRELRSRMQLHSNIQLVINYVEQVALYYDKVRSLGKLKLNKPEDYVQKYLNEYYLVDMCYRRSLGYFHTVREKEIENDFLQVLDETKRQVDLDYAKNTNLFNLEWMNCVRDFKVGFDTITLPKQEDFYQLERDAAVKQVVIVSDALRYEVAQELMEELSKKKHVATLHPYKAMLPTETKYCKPALLPHTTLELDGDNILVDGQILSTLDSRIKHLEKYQKGALCVSYVDVMNNDQTTNRELFKHPLVYIFHDTIDEAGHTQNPFDVIEACKKAVEQLAVLIPRLHATYNVSNVIVTADHGFLYNDITFEDKDKHSVIDDFIEKKTRYYLTHSTDSVYGIEKMMLDNVSSIHAKRITYVAVPEGTNRLAAAGGYNFAHGGASLQELIIPVIRSSQKRTDKTEKVGVTLVSPKLNLISSQLKFQLLQSEAVTMTIQERTVVCGLYDGDNLVSDEKRLTLSSTDANNINNRIVNVPLYLNKSIKSNLLQLRVYDEGDLLNPLIKAPVTNSTMIEQDF
jgi:uncharacterized protein (TIGR02687 family)